MYVYRLLFLMVLGIYVFSPIIMNWWLEPGGSWYRPYIIWFFVIILSFWLSRQRGDDDF
ncbi:hypothetical protein [Litoribrevibacter albus]|uniref:hypothetical protein n=1 Tax=Litoribrevibacter albus TaxID=1473156 RepID=UPI0024E06D32|nr:hypothetical protein [Litoribrevibacter albus]